MITLLLMVQDIEDHINGTPTINKLADFASYQALEQDDKAHLERLWQLKERMDI
ncbi:hypothetical protein [Mucilaginibacter pineti]|uniref:hypothetical protein n=1 Tax=Mucilaginibacter pineti TaxID=1391627 RepID=UPI0013BE9073|nr:hypothetical protein [Mucilaginibacter pineti]